jgi:hypothetical protein
MKIEAEEPVVILCARDKLAEPGIKMYRLLAASHGCHLTKTLQKEIDGFRQWKVSKSCRIRLSGFPACCD